MRFFVRLWLLAALGLWLVASRRAEGLPLPARHLAASLREPRQTATRREPFAVEAEGITYRVEPIHDYEISGLVVSEHVSHSWWRPGGYHERARDFLNVKDICVLWGPNLRPGVYDRIDYESGEYTCYARPRSAAAARGFDPTALANNHLISDDPAVRRLLRRIRRGDQVRIRGHLAAYAHRQGPRGYRRGTSVRRDDTGNGACETIYVTEAEILRPGNPAWRRLATGAPLGLLLGVVAWLRLPIPRR
jgi:hypothetical protein